MASVGTLSRLVRRISIPISPSFSKSLGSRDDKKSEISGSILRIRSDSVWLLLAGIQTERVLRFKAK